MSGGEGYEKVPRQTLFKLREAAVDRGVCITCYLQTPKSFTISRRTTEFGTDIQEVKIQWLFCRVQKCSKPVQQRTQRIPIPDKMKFLGQKMLKQENQRLMKFRTVSIAGFLNWCEGRWYGYWGDGFSQGPAQCQGKLSSAEQGRECIHSHREVWFCTAPCLKSVLRRCSLVSGLRQYARWVPHKSPSEQQKTVWTCLLSMTEMPSPVTASMLQAVFSLWENTRRLGVSCMPQNTQVIGLM